jgi:hypothetical protein
MCDGCSDALDPRKTLHECVSYGVYLVGVYLTGVHLMGVYLINVHLTGHACSFYASRGVVPKLMVRRTLD